MKHESTQQAKRVIKELEKQGVAFDKKTASLLIFEMTKEIDTAWQTGFSDGKLASFLESMNGKS